MTQISKHYLVALVAATQIRRKVMNKLENFRFISYAVIDQSSTN